MQKFENKSRTRMLAIAAVIVMALCILATVLPAGDSDAVSTEIQVGGSDGKTLDQAIENASGGETLVLYSSQSLSANIDKDLTIRSADADNAVTITIGSGQRCLYSNVTFQDVIFADGVDTGDRVLFNPYTTAGTETSITINFNNVRFADNCMGDTIYLSPMGNGKMTINVNDSDFTNGTIVYMVQTTNTAEVNFNRVINANLNFSWGAGSNDAAPVTMGSTSANINVADSDFDRIWNANDGGNDKKQTVQISEGASISAGDVVNDCGMTVVEGGSLAVEGTLTNNSSFSNSGNLSVEGTLTNNSSFSNSGYMVNNGTIVNSGSVDNTGIVVNEGTVTGGDIGGNLIDKGTDDPLQMEDAGWIESAFESGETYVEYTGVVGADTAIPTVPEGATLVIVSGSSVANPNGGRGFTVAEGGAIGFSGIAAASTFTVNGPDGSKVEFVGITGTGIKVTGGSSNIEGSFGTDSSGSITVTGESRLTGDVVLGDGVSLTVVEGTSLEIPSGMTLTVGRNSMLVNDGTIYNYGTISNGGAFLNDGHVGGTGVVDSMSGYISGSGTIDNEVIQSDWSGDDDYPVTAPEQPESDDDSEIVVIVAAAAAAAVLMCVFVLMGRGKI